MNDGKTQRIKKPSAQEIAAWQREIAEWEATSVPCGLASLCAPDGTPVWSRPPVVMLDYTQRPDVLRALEAYEQSGADEIVSEWRSRIVGATGMVALFLTLPGGFRFHVALPLLRDAKMDTAIYHMAVTRRIHIPLGLPDEAELALTVELMPFPDLTFFAISPTITVISQRVAARGGIIDRSPEPAEIAAQAKYRGQEPPPAPAPEATYQHNQGGHMMFVRRNWLQLAGLAWKGYREGGRGFLLIKVKNIAEPQPFAPALYVPATKATTIIPDWERDPIAGAVGRYDPEQSMVVVFTDEEGRTSVYRLSAGGTNVRPADAPPPQDSAQSHPMA